MTPRSRRISSRSCAGLVVTIALPMLLACSEDPLAPPPATGENDATSDSALVSSLAAAYRTRSAERFASLLARRDGVSFVFLAADPLQQTTHWSAEEEQRIHQRMFAPDELEAGDAPVPPELGIDSVYIDLTPVEPFHENPAYYRDAAGRTNPEGVDPGRWRVTEARYRTGMLLFTRGFVFPGVGGGERFVVLEDRTRRPGEHGKFLLYRWEELPYRLDASPDGSGGTAATPSRPGMDVAASAVPSVSWTHVKRTYAGDAGIGGGAAVMDALAAAYRQLDTDALPRLLASDGPASFREILPAPALDGQLAWDRAAEIALHERMFHPLTASPPVPHHLRVRAADVQFWPQTDFVERPELLREGLDAVRWRALQATYRAIGAFTTQDTSRIVLNDIVRVAVLDDRTLPRGAAGKFTLFRWEERVPRGSAAAGSPLAMAGSAVAWDPAGVDGSLCAGSQESCTWVEWKQLCLPPPSLDSPETLVRCLQHAYRWRDATQFIQLLAADPGADYTFERGFTDPGNGTTAWDRGTEVRIHMRMFSPEIAWPGRPPVPRDLHLESLRPAFVARTPFAERHDLYRDPVHNPAGLDPTRWRALGATYDAEAMVLTWGPTDYQVHGGARFVVVEDLAPGASGADRFRLYRWSDLGWDTRSKGIEPASWTSWKTLYQ